MSVMRQAHWIRGNKQERIPPRMVAFDTESRSVRSNDVETQSWRVGCAIRWRTDTKLSDNAEARVFNTPQELWQWVSEYCRKGARTVVWAHNLSHDVRISQTFTILPSLGFELEWCNLDRDVSSMTWRSDHGTIVMADTYTWVPLPLGSMAPMAGLVKFGMPGKGADDDMWATYCMRDAQIVYRVVSELVGYVRDNHLGNWQPTGAGMAYATWRHKYMDDKILVHDDIAALEAERHAMYAGRAEAWKHGEFHGPVWTEVDMRNAYVTIGAECELPRKLHMHSGAINAAQYRDLASRYRVLCRVRVRTDTPVLPYRQRANTLWPVGTFEGWYWDTEIDCALRYGAQVKVLESYCYVRSPVLQEWAKWILRIVQDKTSDVNPIVRTWLKHCSRALIGRLALRTRNWELWASNPEAITGITRVTEPDTRLVRRLMHVGDKTFIEGTASEAENSVPMITGWIMAECRVRLWDAMNAAGLDQVAHVDTDSMLISAGALDLLHKLWGAGLGGAWQAKGSWSRLELYGPRSYVRGKERVMAGIPKKAAQRPDGAFEGERWASLAADLEDRGDGVVTTWRDTWTTAKSDPRRRDSPGADGDTLPYEVGSSGLSSMSVTPRLPFGE